MIMKVSIRAAAPWLAFAALSLAGGCGVEKAEPAAMEQVVATSVATSSEYQPGEAPSPESWPANGRDNGQTRYSPLNQINSETVGRLGYAWQFSDFMVRGRTHHGMESNPVLYRETLFVTGPWGSVHAIDARTGKQKWSFEPPLEFAEAKMACCDVVNRGLAIADDKIFVGAFDGFLYALDASSGDIVWQIDSFVDRKWNYTITSAPFIAGDVVMIGNAGSDMGARGYVSAYDVKTGELVWRFWSVPGDPKAGPDETPEVTMARATWPKDTRWELGLGGNAWDNLGYDPETNTAFLGIGNGGPHPAWLRSESGEITDQLFLSSIVAVDADTGRLKWYYQTTPGDSWDYAATSHMILANLEIDGRERKVLMQAPKNGVFYILDRETGELLRADPYTDVTWMTGVDMKTGRPNIAPEAYYKDKPVILAPSPIGAHAWTPMSYHPETGLVYFHVYELALKVVEVKPVEFMRGAINQGNTPLFPPFDTPEDKAFLAAHDLKPKFEARLKAWDPVAGKAAWQTEPLPFVSGGTLSTGDLVFQGTGGGYLDAYDAATGERLLHLFVGTNIMGAPITYELDGVQYIAVTAGAGGPQGSQFAPDSAAFEYENYERVIVLKLDGGDVPLPPKRDPAPDQPLPTPIAASDEVIEHGKALYEYHCHRCHTMGGAVGNYPNLWNAPPFVFDAFEMIVRDGAYRPAGMSGFGDELSDDDIAAIKAFIVNDTIKAKTLGEDAASRSNVANH